MRKLKLKGIVVISALSIILTGCQTSNESLSNNNNYNSPTIIYEETVPNEVESKPTDSTMNSPSSEENSTTKEEQSSESFTFFKEAKEEIIAYMESERFAELKSQGKYYVTTGIDFIFFDVPINGVYFNDLTEDLKADIIRDVKGLDEAIMAYYPDYKESFSSKYQVASEFVSEKYLEVMDSIKAYLGEENYNAVGEIKDQIKEDISEKADEVVEDIKGLYKGWKNN